MIAALGITLLGILAGWVVNLLADTMPDRRSLRQTWHWPLQRFGLLSPQPVYGGTDWSATVSTTLPTGRRYLLVWLVAICLGWFAYLQVGLRPQAFLVAAEAWFFLTIAVIDLEHRLVLNRMLLAASPAVLGANLLIGHATITSALLGAAAGFGLFLLIALLAPGGMGMGDVKLAGLIGLTTGLSSVLSALFIAILIGGIAGAVVLFKSRFRRGQTMAYAPYLVVGVWVVLFDGIGLLHSYLEHL
ncbi:MAG: A24 family peptidase [Caldilineaceae bacterium]